LRLFFASFSDICIHTFSTVIHLVWSNVYLDTPLIRPMPWRAYFRPFNSNFTPNSITNLLIKRFTYFIPTTIIYWKFRIWYSQLFGDITEIQFLFQFLIKLFCFRCRQAGAIASRRWRHTQRNNTRVQFGLFVSDSEQY